MIINETLETKIADSCDVLVCGGGIAGISAALAAARLNKKVILLERQYMLGGLGTAGLITIYLPLCDGCGKQVSFGIAEELLRLSISLGYEGMYPDNWLDSVDSSRRTNKDKRFEVQYNPQCFAMLAEKLLIDNGVEILYGTYAVGVSKTEDKIDAVIIENKSGRQGISVGSVVDATGDCDIALFAGVPTETFGEGNSLAAWYYSLGDNGYKLNMVGFLDVPDEEKRDAEKVETSDAKKYQGVDGGELSKMVQQAHTSILNCLAEQRKTDKTTMPVTIATIPQVRMTRKIVGEYILDESEVHKYFADSVGLVSDWRRRGPVFEVPFGTLYSKTVKNLITAGRCTSVTDDMWDIMRVIPCCAVTGQAAGTAAALSNDFTKLDINHLQNVLKENGVKTHEKDL